MKISQINITLTRKITDHAFGSMSVGVGATAEVEDGDSAEVCYENLFQFVKCQLEKKIEVMLP